MALPFESMTEACDPRAPAILAKTIYRELRARGYRETDVMRVASELLGLLTTAVQDRRSSGTLRR
jgi:hypothetical protein